MSLGRKPQQASDYRSVSVLRDGGGDFPTLDAALEYLNGSGFTPDATNFFTITLGAGTFSVDNSAGAVSLPEFVALIGVGSQLTNIVGSTAANPLFTCENLTLQELAISNCTVAIDKVASSSGTLSIFRCEFNNIETAVECLDGFTFINNTTIRNFDGPGVIINGGTVAAVTSCQLVTPIANAKFIEINLGNVSIRNNAFDSTLISGTTGLDVNDGIRVESANNVFTDVETAITLADDVSLNFSSKADRITGETTSISIEGAAGTNSATYQFSDLTCSPETMSLNGNRPPQGYTDDEGDTFTNRHSDIVVGTTTLDHKNDIVLCNSGSGFTVNLPPKAFYANKHYTIKNINTGTVTIDGDSSDTIDGSATLALSNQWDFVTLYCDEAATEWYVIATNF